MLRIAILRSAQGLDAVRAAWERLYRPGRHTVFQTAAWNLLAARAFAARTEPLIIHAESDSGAAIIPACEDGERISLLGEALFDYRDVLAEGDDTVMRRAWRELGLAGRSLSVTALCGECARQEWEEMGFSTAEFCGAPGTRLVDSSADAFAAAHTRSARLLRRLAHAGVQVRSHGGAESTLVRQIYQAKAQQGIAGNLFSDPVRIDFMVAIAAADRGCEIFTLETAGSLVAALVTFRDDHVRRFYTICFDPAWAHASPGVALVYEITRLSLHQGLDCDYMTGEQPHKMRFATHVTPLFRVQADAQDLARIAAPRAAFDREPAPRQPAA